MGKNWTPPKGISISYKAKGYRKKTERADEEETKPKSGQDRDDENDAEDEDE